MNEAATQYVARGRKFLAQASEELARDDLEQASEKGWGAAAQSLKAVAAERGWQHGQHRQLYTITRQLAEEEGSDELRGLFRYATDLHTNFYEGQMEPVEVEFSLGKGERTRRAGRSGHRQRPLATLLHYPLNRRAQLLCRHRPLERIPNHAPGVDHKHPRLRGQSPRHERLRLHQLPR